MDITIADSSSYLKLPILSSLIFIQILVEIETNLLERLVEFQFERIKNKLFTI